MKYFPHKCHRGRTQGVEMQVSAHPLDDNIGYNVFIDEAGDPGLAAVKPIDEAGSSEWFVLSALVVRKENLPLVEEYAPSLIVRFKSQTNDIHFRKLSEHKKGIATKKLAELPVRLFVLCSNKKNIRRYNNQRAQSVGLYHKDWYYNYCLRVLIERVSEWIAQRSMADNGEFKKAKFTFSERGGHRYSHLKAYFELLSIQDRKGRVFQSVRVPKFEVLDHRLFDVETHSSSGGCQAADVIASAFYQAVNTSHSKWNPQFAVDLKPRIATLNGAARNAGLTLLPWNRQLDLLNTRQQIVFRRFNYWTGGTHKPL